MLVAELGHVGPSPVDEDADDGQDIGRSGEEEGDVAVVLSGTLGSVSCLVRGPIDVD